MSLSQREHISYGVGDVGASLSYTVINTFLLSFLLDGLTLAPLIAGAVVLCGRIVDAVSDPLMGSVLDRFGKHQRWIVWGALPFGLSFGLLWLLDLPVLSNLNPTALALAAAGLLCLHTLAFTLVQVPYTALTPRLASQYHSRTKLTAYRVAFGTIASLLAVALPPILVAQLGWGGMGFALGILMTLGYLLCCWGLPKIDTTPNASASQAMSAVALWKQWQRALASFGFAPLLFIFIFINLGMGVVTSMLPFFLRSLALTPTYESMLLGLLFGMGVISLPFWTWISKRIGKAHGLALALAILCGALPLLSFGVTSQGISVPLLLGVVLAGIPIGGLLLFPWSMLPDILEFQELQRDSRQEGAIYALFTFVQKLAAAVGIALNAGLLALVGYQAGGDSTDGIRLAIGLVAVVLFGIALTLAWRYPITPQSHAEARARLS